MRRVEEESWGDAHFLTFRARRPTPGIEALSIDADLTAPDGHETRLSAELAGADVRLRDGVVQAVGVGLDSGDDEIVEAAGCVVTPGLVNTHHHLYQTLTRAVPGAQDVRGFSFFGDSYVYVIFDEGTDLYWARSRVLEYLSQVSSKLPTNARPELGPDATGVGWAFMYALNSPSRSLAGCGLVRRCVRGRARDDGQGRVPG